MEYRALLAVLVSQLLSFSGIAGTADKTLDVYWLDVEGGSATLIVSPENESVLIDAGNPGTRDAGRIHHVAAEVAGLKQMDHLIITHFHSDHVGGAAELAKLMPIGTVYDRGIPDHDPDGQPNDAQFARLITPYRDMPAKQRVIIKPDDLIPLRPSEHTNVASLILRCLAVKQSFTRRPATSSATNELCSESTSKPLDTSDNVNSVVMLLAYGPFRLYAGGDLSWNPEAKLVCPVNLVGRVDVYQVDHHGFDDASNPILIHSLTPTVAVMSNGPRKGGEPGVFATLRSVPSFQSLYQIHRNLSGRNPTNAPDEYIANLAAESDGNYIKLSVAPDGRSYTVSIPANGHHRTYQTTLKKTLN